MFLGLLLSLFLFQINSKVLQSTMKMFQPASNTYQSTQMKKDYIKSQQQSSKIMMSNIATIKESGPLYFAINMAITPFEEIHSGDNRKVFKASIKFSDNNLLKLDCYYSKQNKLKIISIYTKDKQENVKDQQIDIKVLKWNNIVLNFNYSEIAIPVGNIQILVEFQQVKPYFKGSVSNLTINIWQSNQIISEIFKNSISQWISTVDPISHPISLKNLVLPSNLQSNKPPHQIPILSNGQKLLVCHDMGNGYKEDIDEYSNKFSKHAYRFHHWKISDIFVYFSHHNIAIPPKHYTMLCKRQKVLCLATFIVQAPFDWLKLEMADFLVFLASEYQFDGYLINIEFPVSNVTLFSEWLIYLTNKIHAKLPNSKIVLYDAIVKDGSVRWQSGLSSQNIQFMDTIDYFFSDYHWNLQSLKNTAGLAQNLGRTSDIFMGTDVFGRGTYGGGMFNTYIGVRQVDKYNLSTAIFAPGYVYQNQGGRTNYSRFQQLDDKLWFGKNSIQKYIKFQQWYYVTLGWKQEGNEAVTAPFNSVRMYKSPINTNDVEKIIFFANVKGTLPDVKDPYKISLELLDADDKTIKQVSTGLNFSFASEEDHQVVLTLSLNQAQKARAKFARVIETGHDAENWNQYYGVRFSQEVLHFASMTKQKSVSDYFQERPEHLPYQSFYNTAVGPNYFYEGKKVINKTGYNFLLDYDLPYQNKRFFSYDSFDQKHSSVNVITDYDQQIGWIGSGNLRISSQESNFALRLIKLQQQVSEVFVKLILKVNKQKLPLIGVKFKTGSVEVIEPKSQIKGDWRQLTAHFDFKGVKSLQSVYLVYESQNSEIQTVINIGEIVVYEQPVTIVNKFQPQIVTMKCIDDSGNCIDLYVDMKQFPIGAKRVYLQVNNKIVGSMYESTAFFKSLTGELNNLSVKLFGLSADGNISEIYQKLNP